MDLAIAAIVNSLGVIASAGVGVAEKLCGFIMLAPSSFGQSLSAFVAQNIGAGRKDRAKKAMLYGMGSSLCCGVALAWLSFFHFTVSFEPFTGFALLRTAFFGFTVTVTAAVLSLYHLAAEAVMVMVQIPLP